MSGDKKQLSFKKLVLNPGLIGVLLAIILFITGFKLPYIISQPVEYLAVLNTPLPMLIIGFYLSQADVAITQAMVIMGVTRHNDITTAVIIGKAIRRTAATTVFSLATMPLVVMLTGMMSGFSS